MRQGRIDIVGYLVATLGVGLVTLALWLLQTHVDNPQRGLLFLLVVAAAAAASGTRAGVLAAVLGFLSWNFFFLPPILTFQLTNSRDWLTLFTFLFIGTLVGQMTGRMRAREADARAREEETAALYRMAQTLNEHSAPAGALPIVAEQILQMIPLRTLAVLGLDAKDQVALHAFGGDASVLGSTETERIVRWVLAQARAAGLPPAPPGESIPWPFAGSWRDVGVDGDRRDLYLPLATGRRVSGVLMALPEGEGTLDVSACRHLVAAAAQISAFMERHLLQLETADLAARQEAEKMRVVLFSSLSHNLKTPLASLNATLGGLTARDVEWTPEMLRESVDLMAEDVKRLTLHIGNLLDLARLESGTWQPQRESSDVQELVETALRHLPADERTRIRVGAMAGNPSVSVDPVQIGQVIRHLVENALMYSPTGSPVTVDATTTDHGRVELTVDDQGEGVAPDERERIFEKFYRGRAAKKSSTRGTGLGLSICREIISAHAGLLEVRSSPSGRTRFAVSLPLEKGPAVPGNAAAFLEREGGLDS